MKNHIFDPLTPIQKLVNTKKIFGINFVAFLGLQVPLDPKIGHFIGPIFLKNRVK